jgi:hypothetical protein
MKKADVILREAVREMVAAVEVPSGLGVRVEKILAGEQKKPLANRLQAFLKNPAAAAAVLLLVVTAGILSFHTPFKSEVKQLVAASPETRDSSAASDLVAPVTHGDAPATSQAAITEESNTSSARDNRQQPAIKPEFKPDSKVENTSKGQQSISAQDMVNPLSAKNLGSRDQTPPASGKTPASQEKPFLAAVRAAGGRGTLEKAASELGFSPARPSYLPPGTELQEVTWSSDAVYQNYTNGQVTFVISQSRANIKVAGADVTPGQGTPIEINGAKAVLQENKAGSGDGVSREPATIQWQQGDWVYSVSGRLPVDEIIKIASSLK